MRGNGLPKDKQIDKGRSPAVVADSASGTDTGNTLRIVVGIRASKCMGVRRISATSPCGESGTESRSGVCQCSSHCSKFSNC